MSIQLTLLAEGFPASPSVLPGSEEAQTILDTSGQQCLMSLQQLSPNMLWVKTFTALLIGTRGWYSTRCVLIWKLKGMKSNRFYCQLRALTHLTNETEYGLLPTPKATDCRMHWRTKNWKGDDLGSEINHRLGTRSHLHPSFVGEVMGFPLNWTVLPFQSGVNNQLKPTATP